MAASVPPAAPSNASWHVLARAASSGAGCRAPRETFARLLHQLTSGVLQISAWRLKSSTVPAQAMLNTAIPVGDVSRIREVSEITEISPLLEVLSSWKLPAV